MQAETTPNAPGGAPNRTETVGPTMTPASTFPLEHGECSAGPTAPHTATDGARWETVAGDACQTAEASADVTEAPPNGTGAQQAQPNGPVEINGHPVHPYASLFPMMPDAELDELAQDIKLNGQAEPILMWRGMILDGRNRMEACRRAGVDPKTTDDDALDERTALGLVASRNIHRRHLDTSQRAMLAADLTRRRNASESAQIQAAMLPVGLTQAEAAKTMNVSERSVRTARAVQQADPQIAARVRSGEITANAALKQVGNGLRKPAAPTTPKQRAAKTPSLHSSVEEIKTRLVQAASDYRGAEGLNASDHYGCGLIAADLLRHVLAKVHASSGMTLKARVFGEETSPTTAGGPASPPGPTGVASPFEMQRDHADNQRAHASSQAPDGLLSLTGDKK
jgi:hypothetical protein